MTLICKTCIWIGDDEFDVTLSEQALPPAFIVRTYVDCDEECIIEGTYYPSCVPQEVVAGMLDDIADSLYFGDYEKVEVN